MARHVIKFANANSKQLRQLREFHKTHRLVNEHSDRENRNTVGFMLSFLRLRFASSLFAIRETLRRRRDQVRSRQKLAVPRGSGESNVVLLQLAPLFCQRSTESPTSANHRPQSQAHRELSLQQLPRSGRASSLRLRDFALITSTSVGYGDITPDTQIGQLISVPLALIGTVFFGLVVATATRAVTLTVQEYQDAQGDPQINTVWKELRVAPFQIAPSLEATRPA